MSNNLDGESLTIEKSDIPVRTQIGEGDDSSDNVETNNSQPQLKVMSWNINGIKTIDMPKVLDKLQCDVIGIQETKLTRGNLDATQINPEGYTSYFSFCANRPGYAGVATYCKENWTPFKAEEGLSKVSTGDNEIGMCPDMKEGEDTHILYANADGRAVLTQHAVMLPDGSKKNLVIINVYCPRHRCDEPEVHNNNTDYKRSFHDFLHRRAKALIEAGYYVIFLGDMNIRHRWIDQCDETDPKKFGKNQFRTLLDDLLCETDPLGLVDSFRNLHGDISSAYTCWCTKLNARENNFGSRIDYIFVNKELAKYVAKAEIHPDVMGSDHCPISVTFHSLTAIPCDSPPAFATQYFLEFGGKQKKLIDYYSVQSAQIPLPPSIKRGSPAKKRPRETSNSNGSQGSKRLQTSLRTFFSSKSKPESASTNANTIAPSQLETVASSTEQVSPMGNSKPKNDASATWKTLMKAPEVPLCQGHNEPCVKRMVKKKGANFGRQFWSCSHGIGKSDDPNANCNFFQWLKTTPAKSDPNENGYSLSSI